MSDSTASPQGTLFGHPTGLFTLFFAEMWERFSYYGMRALLVFYMIKGFLGYGDGEAYGIYGAYTALVYMTPFFGGMLADKVLGKRRAVILGGLLMSAGHAVMMIEQETAFFVALALLIAGNGFFKPNISSIVGTLYPDGSPKRDGGFTIFYMGINLGAAIAPLLCGYVGETYGWHLGFGLATAGMIAGVTVFWLPTRLAQAAIGGTALVGAVALFWFHPDNPYVIATHVFLGIALLASGAVACVALGRGGLPDHAGAPPSRSALAEKCVGPINKEWTVYLGTLLLVPVITLFVCGFSILRSADKPITLIAESTIEDMKEGGKISQVVAVFAEEVSKPAGLVLSLTGLFALIYLLKATFRLATVQRQRMYVVMILTFFSMLFWAFFEQAGSSINNFTDRNVDRVTADKQVEASNVGTTIRLQPTQAQLGYKNGDELFTLTNLDNLREKNEETPDFEIDWTVTESNVGMVLATRQDEIPASSGQAFNPTYILIFGLIFTSIWGFLSARGKEPSTPFKFALGLLQLALGFGALWYGAQNADDRGMVAMSWLALGYLLHTTGELCLSPVGLSMVTKLSPKYLVSTVMGTWFLATAFSQYLAAIISQFTGVSHGGGGDENVVPAPTETVNIYGDVFGQIAVTGLVCAGICFLMVPLLKKWMHEGVVVEDD